MNQLYLVCIAVLVIGSQEALGQSSSAPNDTTDLPGDSTITNNDNNTLPDNGTTDGSLYSSTQSRTTSSTPTTTDGCGFLQGSLMTLLLVKFFHVLV